MIIELDVGAKNLAAGVTNVRGRAERTGGMVVTPVHGDFSETTLAQKCNILSNAVAGIAHGTAFGTTPPLALWNPPSSGINALIHKIGMSIAGGTLGYGYIGLGQTAQATVPTGGTELTPVNPLLGWPRGVCRGFTGSTIAGTPTIIRPSVTYGAFAGAAAVPAIVSEVLGGEIVLTPGNVLALQGIGTAGTAPLCVFWIYYEEVNA